MILRVGIFFKKITKVFDQNFVISFFFVCLCFKIGSVGSADQQIKSVWPNSNRQVIKSNLQLQRKHNGKDKENLKCPNIITFYCKNVTFLDNLQNLWAKHRSLKTVNGNMSRMYYTKVNFTTQRISIQALKISFFSLWRLPWNLEIYRFSKVVNSDTNWIFPIPFKVLYISSR